MVQYLNMVLEGTFVNIYHQFFKVQVVIEIIAVQLCNHVPKKYEEMRKKLHFYEKKHTFYLKQQEYNTVLSTCF